MPSSRRETQQKRDKNETKQKTFKEMQGKPWKVGRQNKRERYNRYINYSAALQKWEVFLPDLEASRASSSLAV